MRVILAAVAITMLAAAPASAAPCRGAKGKFIKCAPAPMKPVKCKDAKGRFAKCGAAGSKSL